MQCITFEDLLSSPDKKFLKIFAPSFTSRPSDQGTSEDQKDQDSKAPRMSKIPMSSYNFDIDSLNVKRVSENNFVLF